MSGINIAWSPARPRVPPPQVTINNVPVCKFFKFVSLTTILMHGGQARLISLTKENTIVKKLVEKTLTGKYLSFLKRMSIISKMEIFS